MKEHFDNAEGRWYRMDIYLERTHRTKATNDSKISRRDVYRLTEKVEDYKIDKLDNRTYVFDPMLQKVERTLAQKDAQVNIKKTPELQEKELAHELAHTNAQVKLAEITEREKHLNEKIEYLEKYTHKLESDNERLIVEKTQSDLERLKANEKYDTLMLAFIDKSREIKQNEEDEKSKDEEVLVNESITNRDSPIYDDLQKDDIGTTKSKQKEAGFIKRIINKIKGNS